MKVMQMVLLRIPNSKYTFWIVLTMAIFLSIYIHYIKRISSVSHRDFYQARSNLRLLPETCPEPQLMHYMNEIKHVRSCLKNQSQFTPTDELLYNDLLNQYNWYSDAEKRLIAAKALALHSYPNSISMTNIDPIYTEGAGIFKSRMKGIIYRLSEMKILGIPYEIQAKKIWYSRAADYKEYKSKIEKLNEIIMDEYVKLSIPLLEHMGSTIPTENQLSLKRQHLLYYALMYDGYLAIESKDKPLFPFKEDLLSHLGYTETDSTNAIDKIIINISQIGEDANPTNKKMYFALVLFSCNNYTLTNFMFSDNQPALTEEVKSWLYSKSTEMQ